VARRGGGGGAASATAAVGSNVPHASRSAAAAFFARMDVRRQCYCAGGYESRCWTARLEGGGGRREASSSLRRTTTMDGIFPRHRRDGDGCGDTAVPSDRRRRRLRRRRGTTRRDATRGGGGDDKGQASGDNSPSRRDAAELEALWRCERSGDMSLSGKLGGLRSRGGGQKTSATFFTSATFLGSF
jgi:hypothetical protein